MEMSLAILKTFFTGILLALFAGLGLALVVRPSHEWMQTNRTTVISIFLILGFAVSAIYTVWRYWILIPEVERITRDMKWDEWAS